MSDIVISIAALEADQTREAEQTEPTPFTVIVTIGTLVGALCVGIGLLCLRDGWRSDRDGQSQAC